MTSPMKGLLKGLRYIARIFDEKEPEMQIGIPTDVKHVAHIGWEGPSATTPSWMHDYKSEAKGSPNKKPASSKERHRNKGRRKASTETNNSPAESPTRPSRRNTGKQREQNNTSLGSESGSGLVLPQQSDQSMGPKNSRQRKSKLVSTEGGEPPSPCPPVRPTKSKETDISMRAVYPCVGLGSSTRLD
ncbi:unnamed protein product [Cochlearia groenlandica]